jgi:membrane protein YdbS with pleckstrin-like domain
LTNQFIFGPAGVRIDPVSRVSSTVSLTPKNPVPITINDNDLDDSDVERLIWQGGYSFKSMLGAFLGAALVTALMLIAVNKIQALHDNRTVWTTMAALISMIWTGLFLVAVYRKLARRYEITTQRLIHRSGIFLRQVDRIEMIDIDDVTYRQGPIQALMNVGTIQLLSSDTSHPKLMMPGISRVDKVANMIDDARRMERRKRGIHIESI